MSKEEKLLKLKENLAELENKVNDPKLGEGTATSFARVTGYCRQISNMNLGKQEEVKDRKAYKMA